MPLRRLGSANPTYIDVEMMDSNPISHFLSPTILPDDDLDDFIFDLDAGIENPKYRRTAMQSVVSPSKLDYYSRTFGLGAVPTSPSSQLSRSPSSWSSSTTSDTDSDMCTTDEDDDDDECYVNFMSSQPAIKMDSADFSRGPRSGARSRRSGKFSRIHDVKPRSKLTSAPSPAVSMPRVPQFSSGGGTGHLAPISPVRARAHHYQQQQQQQQHQQPKLNGRRSLLLSSNSWREPSPDVWSISEEAEEEETVAAVPQLGEGGKIKKKVRFVLTPEVI